MNNINKLVNVYTQVILQFPGMNLYVLCMCTHTNAHIHMYTYMYTGNDGSQYKSFHFLAPRFSRLFGEAKLIKTKKH